MSSKKKGFKEREFQMRNPRFPDEEEEFVSAATVEDLLSGEDFDETYEVAEYELVSVRKFRQKVTVEEV